MNVPNLDSYTIILENFFTSDYSDKCVDLMRKYPDVVSGLIAQSRLDKFNPEVVIMTPGKSIGILEGLCIFYPIIKRISF